MVCHKDGSDTTDGKNVVQVPTLSMQQHREQVNILKHFKNKYEKYLLRTGSSICKMHVLA